MPAGGSAVRAPHSSSLQPPQPNGAAQRSVRPETLTGQQLQEETLTSLKKEKKKEEKDGDFFHHQGAGSGLLINFGKER